MKDLIINNVMSNIFKLDKYSDSKLIEIRYGLESLYLLITKLVVIIFLSLVFNIFEELMCFIVAFSLLKISAFGLHAKKGWQCWLASIVIFTTIPFLIKLYVVNNIIMYRFMPLFIISFYLYAPADTEKKPIISNRKRSIYKVVTLLTSFIYISLIVIVKSSYLSSILFYSMLLESILINPLVYKLFGLNYNNYLSYIKKGEKI